MTDHTGKELADKASTEEPSITCDAYKQLRADAKPHILLDVREEDEFNAGHVEGALHIPRGFLEFKAEEAMPDKHALIIVCCAHGSRAALATETLEQMGYDNVKFLQGGYTEYCQQ